MAKHDDIEEVMLLLGTFGKYQKGQFCLHILGAMMAGIHMLSLVTVAAIPGHTCNVPEGGTAIDKCTYTDANNEVQQCTSWTYDKTYFESSRVIEWNMVCSRQWMGATAQSVYMLGVFTGACILGSLADKYGRKIIFNISGLAQLILGVGVAFIPEFYSFLVVKFILGIFGSAGAYITGFVLSMELIGQTKRSTCGVVFQIMFALGLMLVAGWGYFINSRFWLQIIYGLHACCLLGHWWLMDESPRWLWSQNRISEAIAIVQKGLKRNKSTVVLNAENYISKYKNDTAESSKSYNISDLFKIKSIRNRTLNICYNWFANSIVYYGLTLSATSLKNPYLTLFLSGVIEIPTYIMVIFLMDRAGRRIIMTVTLVTGGLCCILAMYLELLIQNDNATTVVALIGKFCIAASFAIIYIYTCELFPTVVRNTVIGVGSMCARLSGAVTPMILLLNTLNPVIPATFFGICAILAGLFLLLLPETLNKPMPDTFEDIM